MREIVLILDNIRSVENTGSIFRTAECLGVRKIYLIGTTPAPLDRFGRARPDFSKVALGAETLIKWEYSKDIIEVIKELKSQNFKIIALEQNENSKDLKDLKDFKAPLMIALVVGNEVEGVSGEALKLCDSIIEIEMKGEKESLNVSVATGIALFELFK